MKKPKILKYMWEELYGLEEIDSPRMEAIRVMFRTMLSGPKENHTKVLRYFLNCNKTYFVCHPSDDIFVIIYRLLENFDPQFRKTINGPTIENETLSMEDFMEIVSSQFIKKPMPIIVGKKPEISI